MSNSISTRARVFHWSIALCILAMWTLGFYMTRTESYQFYHSHKSIGLLLIGLLFLRLLLRSFKGLPAPAHNYPKHEQVLAKLTHWALLILCAVMPIFGIMYSVASGHDLGIFGWELIHHNLANGSEEVAPRSVFWMNTGQTMHAYLNYVLAAALVLHISGALKHHFIDKDNTLKRMFRGKTSEGVHE